MGKHIWDAPEFGTENNGLYGIVTGTLSICAASWSKTSFALTLTRLTTGRLKAFVWFSIWAVNVCLGLAALVTWISCTPIPKAWHMEMEGTCWPSNVTVIVGIIGCVCSGVLDLVLAMIPWAIIWKLQMRPAEKIGIVVAMSMGIFAAATAFVKSSKISKLAAGDISYEIADLAVWSTAEAAVSIMAASLPVLRVLIRDVKNSSANKYGRHTDETGDMYGSTRKSHVRGYQNTTTVTVERLPSEERGYFGADDGASDKSIIRDAAAPTTAAGGIIRRDEVKVAYSTYRPEDSDGYELQNVSQP